MYTEWTLIRGITVFIAVVELGKFVYWMTVLNQCKTERVTVIKKYCVKNI